LALTIDNDQVLLRKVRDRVGTIIDGNWSKQSDMARVLRDTLYMRFGIEYLRGELDGWQELLEHYEAQVLEERNDDE